MSVIDELIRMDRESPSRILIIGDVMTDVYVHGRIEKCQDDCDKFVEEMRVVVPGGAANAARSLKNWSAQVLLYGQLFGPTKTRFMVGDRCLLRHDDDQANADLSYLNQLRRMALEVLRSGGQCPDAILLSDYDKGMLEPLFIAAVAGACLERGILCVADCKRAPGLYPGCILKCNQDYQHKHNDRLSQLVYDADVGQRLVVTAGPLNPIIWDGDRPQGLGHFLPPVPCCNHVGAGDCFGAHLVLALAHGFSLKDAVAIAHSAGRVYVQYPHNRPPTPEEVARDMKQAAVGVVR